MTTAPSSPVATASAATHPPVAAFPCSPGGSVAQGRRRLRQGLGALLLLMLAIAIWAFTHGRIGAGLLALVAGIGPLFALGLVGETDLEGLELRGGHLAIRSSSGTELVPLAGAACRRLSEPEIRHLERLATTAGIVAGVGGFDSGQLGELDLYATDLSHAVLVEAEVEGEARRVVVTPDDPAAFLAAVGR